MLDRLRDEWNGMSFWRKVDEVFKLVAILSFVYLVWLMVT